MKGYHRGINLNTEHINNKKGMNFFFQSNKYASFNYS